MNLSEKPVLAGLPRINIMPAKSRAQRIAMAIAEHHPEKLNPENKGLLEMTHQQLHDFAATPEKGLPVYSMGGLKGKKKNGNTQY